MGAEYRVRVATGSLRSTVRADATLPHRWTSEGVAIELQFTGAHQLDLSAAGCVLNDLYREAAQTGVELKGVPVSADGDFEGESRRSTGITYQVATLVRWAPALGSTSGMCTGSALRTAGSLSTGLWERISEHSASPGSSLRQPGVITPPVRGHHSAGTPRRIT